MKSSRNHSPSPALEALEPKLAPAGVVMLSTAGGVLTITGDAADNVIRILDEPISGTWQISDGSGTPTAFFLNGTAMGTAAFTIPAADAVKASLGDGHDVLVLQPSVDVSAMILNSLSVSGGKGNDDLFLGSGLNERLQVLGATSVDLGEGNDRLIGAVHGTFGGTADFKMGAGGDLLQFGSTTAEYAFLKGFKADLGTGQATVMITADRFDVTGGAFSIAGAGGADLQHTVSLAPKSGTFGGPASIAIAAGGTTSVFGTAGSHVLSFNSTLTITGGAVTDDLSVFGDVAVAGALAVDLKDGANNFLLAADGSLTAGAFTLKGGTGTDQLLVQDQFSVDGAMNLSLGAGDNSVQFQAASTLAAGSFSYTGLAGMDSVLLDATSLRVLAGMTFNTGAGSNTVALHPGSSSGTTSIGGAFLYTGGVGVDFVSFEDTVEIGGAVTVDLKDGDNQLYLEPDASLSAAALTFKAGKGTDQFQIYSNSTLDLRGALNLSLGAGFNFFVTAVGTSVAAASLLYTGATTGTDTVSFQGAALDVRGNLTLAMGDGINSTGLFVTTVFIGGALSITGTALTDVVTFNCGALQVNGATTLNLGNGNNLLTIDGAASFNGPLAFTGGTAQDTLLSNAAELRVNGALTIKAGDGENNFQLEPVNGAIGAVIYTGGKGTDQLFLGDDGDTTVRLTVRGGVTGSFGDGANELRLSDTVVEGGLTMNSAARTAGDVLILNRSTVKGPVLATMGGGVSFLHVQDSFIQGLFTANTGAGADVVRLDTQADTSAAGAWYGKVTINTGAGIDDILIGSSPSATNAGNIFYRAVLIDGGTEADTLVEGNNTKYGPFETKNI